MCRCRQSGPQGSRGFPVLRDRHSA